MTEELTSHGPGRGRSPEILCRFGDTDNLQAWDAARQQSRLRSFFNSPLLIRTMHRHFLPLTVIECWRGDALVGGCYGWNHHTRRGIHRLQSPHTVGEGIVWVRDEGLGPSATQSLTRDVTSALTRFLPQHFDEIYLIAGPEFADPRGFQRAHWRVAPHLTHRLPLSDVTSLWDNLEGTLRRNINRARREGFTVELSDDVGALERAILDMRRRQRAQLHAVQPFLTHVVEAVCAEGCGQLFVARTREGNPAAAALMVWDDLRAHYYVGGYRSGDGDGGAFPLLMWEAISWLCKSAVVPEFDFYGVYPESVGRFKKKFNAPLVWGCEIHFVSRPLLRAYRHSFDLWSAAKRTILRRRYGAA